MSKNFQFVFCLFCTGVVWKQNIMLLLCETLFGWFCDPRYNFRQFFSGICPASCTKKSWQKFFWFHRKKLMVQNFLVFLYFRMFSPLFTHIQPRNHQNHLKSTKPLFVNFIRPGLPIHLTREFMFIGLSPGVVNQSCSFLGGWHCRKWVDEFQEKNFD